jgi:hypothetical protein
MASYNMQMQKAPVRLVLFDGKELRGDLFLHAMADEAGRTETIGARLGAEGARFLPLASEGRVQLVRTNWIAYLEVAGTPPEIAELDELGANRATVALELVTGETLCGDLLYLPPAGTSRISDLLNAPGPRFLLLVVGGLTRYVQRDALARVQL